MTTPEASKDDFVGKQIFFRSRPEKQIWDTKEDDPKYLKMVRLELLVHMSELDPKNGRFKASVRCNWQFRVPPAEDADVATWKASIRMPSCEVELKEERLFKEDKFCSETSSLWRGISSFILSGSETFEVRDFPFDRQIIDLKLLDFRWAPELTSMQVVELKIKTISRLPEWSPYTAIVEPMSVKSRGEGMPSYANRFGAKLPFERKPQYYITNIFMVTAGILLASLIPLGMAPSDIGDRLAVHAGGMLTLVAFKYGVAENLPSVPYSTVADTFLQWQILTLVLAMVETLVGYRMVEDGTLAVTKVNLIEDIILMVVCFVWIIYFVWIAAFKSRYRHSWKQVLESQDEDQEEKV